MNPNKYCKCKHQFKEHVFQEPYAPGRNNYRTLCKGCSTQANKLTNCKYYAFIPISNLEYLEWCVEKKSELYNV